MKLPFTLVCLLLLSLTPAPAALGQKTCARSTPDGEGKAQVSCRSHGCTAICGSSTECYAACGKDMIATRFTLKRDQKRGGEIAAALSKLTRHKIEFVPWKRDGLFDVDVKDDDLWNTMEYLYDRGRLTVDGVSWEEYRKVRRAVLEGRKLSVSFNDISLQDALAHLSFLTGLTFGAETRGAGKVVSLSLQEVTVGEVISRISAQTGIKIKRTNRKAAGM